MAALVFGSVPVRLGYRTPCGTLLVPIAALSRLLNYCAYLITALSLLMAALYYTVVNEIAAHRLPNGYAYRMTAPTQRLRS